MTDNSSNESSDKKFYKTAITIYVLSETPIDEPSLTTIDNETKYGNWVLQYGDYKQEELNGKQMADALYEAASEPGFFQLDDDGNAIDDSDSEEDSPDVPEISIPHSIADKYVVKAIEDGEWGTLYTGPLELMANVSYSQAVNSLAYETVQLIFNNEVVKQWNFTDRNDGPFKF